MTDNFRKFGLADLALILTTFLWGLNAVITKNAVGNDPESFRVFVFNGLRIPAGALLLFAAVRAGGGSILIARKDLKLVMAVSFFGMFLFMTGFVVGLNLTSASNVGVINASIPLFILLVSFLSRIERPTKRTVLGIAVGFCGMLALTFKKGFSAVNPGDLIIIMSAVSWAIYTVYAKKIVAAYSPMLSVAWVYLFTSLYQLPLFFLQLPDQSWGTVSAMNWFNLGLSVVGSLFVANSLYYFAINRIGPSRAGVYTNMTPVFTLILAVLIRGEVVTLLQVAGLVIIVTGIAISKSSPKRKHGQPA